MQLVHPPVVRRLWLISYVGLNRNHLLCVLTNQSRRVALLDSVTRNVTVRHTYLQQSMFLYCVQTGGCCAILSSEQQCNNTTKYQRQEQRLRWGDDTLPTFTHVVDAVYHRSHLFHTNFLNPSLSIWKSCTAAGCVLRTIIIDAVTSNSSFERCTMYAKVCQTELISWTSTDHRFIPASQIYRRSHSTVCLCQVEYAWGVQTQH